MRQPTAVVEKGVIALLGPKATPDEQNYIYDRMKAEVPVYNALV